MIKPDQRKRLQQLQRLRLAADTIIELQVDRPELVALYVHKDIVKQLRTLAEQYEAKPVAPTIVCRECRAGTCTVHRPVLRAHDEERKSRPRVAMSKLRPPMKLSGKMREIPIAQREFDGEAEHEEGQTYGHDIPDGSD